MQLNSKAVFVAYLMLICVCDEVSAGCCSGGSLICCSETIEILVIAVLIALCVVFLIQCIIIVCLAQRLNKMQKRLDTVYLHTRGSSYTMYSAYPGHSLFEKAQEETEGSKMYLPRARRTSGSRAPTNNVTGKSNPASVNDDANGNSEKEIWGLY